MRTQLSVEWGGDSMVVVSEPAWIPAIGDTLSVDDRDTDGTQLAEAPPLTVVARSFGYIGRDRDRLVHVVVACEELVA